MHETLKMPVSPQLYK